MCNHPRNGVRPAPRPHHLLNLCYALLLAMTATGLSAQELDLPDNPLAEPDRWLSADRFSELRYGLTIREPHEPTRIADTAQGDVMRWALPNGTRIRLAFARGAYEGFDARGKHLLMPAKIDLLKKQLSDELKAITGQVINTRTDQVVEVDKIGGLINYFIVKPDKRAGEPHYFGVALLQLDDYSVAILRMECTPEQVVDAVCTFECMVHSIKVDDAKDVNRRIHGWLQNSEQLLGKITQEDKLKAMRDDRLYRALEDNNDIGYIRVWQRFQDEAYYKQLKNKLKASGGTGRLEGIDRFEVEGNAFILQSHLEGRGAVMERLYEAVDTPDDVNGYWQIKRSMRFKNDPKNLRAGIWVETGVRGVAKIGGKATDHVQITREGTPPRHMVEYLLQRESNKDTRLRYPSADPRSYPSGDLVEKAWPTPKRAFLSFVDALLMPYMLPNEEKTYAFTAYHPDTARIDIRLMRVEPTQEGGRKVYIRPVLDLSEQVMVFDRDNELQTWTFPDGRALKQTTRQELAQIWGVRLKN